MTAGKAKKIDELTEQARKLHSKKRFFEAEEKAQAALTAARSARDFGRLGTAAAILGRARRERYEQALATGAVTVVSEAIDDELAATPGCYLIQPPLVGADARRMRQAGLEARAAIAVVCREPITRLRLCPIVAICPGTTIRTQIDPPGNLDEPDVEWFAGAVQQLGEWALSTLDPDMDPVKRVDAIIERLGALPEHEGLHEALADACRTVTESETNDPPAKTGSSGRSAARSR